MYYKINLFIIMNKVYMSMNYDDNQTFIHINIIYNPNPTQTLNLNINI